MWIRSISLSHTPGRDPLYLNKPVCAGQQESPWWAHHASLQGKSVMAPVSSSQVAHHHHEVPQSSCNGGMMSFQLMPTRWTHEADHCSKSSGWVRMAAFVKSFRISGSSPGILICSGQYRAPSALGSIFDSSFFVPGCHSDLGTWRSGVWPHKIKIDSLAAQARIILAICRLSEYLKSKFLLCESAWENTGVKIDAFEVAVCDRVGHHSLVHVLCLLQQAPHTIS